MSGKDMSIKLLNPVDVITGTAELYSKRESNPIYYTYKDIKTRDMIRVKYSAEYFTKGDLYITIEKTNDQPRRIYYAFGGNKLSGDLLNMVSDKNILKRYFVGSAFFEEFIASAVIKKNFSPINKKQTSVIFADYEKHDGLQISFCTIDPKSSPYNVKHNIEHNADLNIIISKRNETILPKAALNQDWVFKLKHSLANIRTL